MRPETTLILSSIDSRTLAEFPPELDPCVNEALRNEAVVEAVKGVWKPLAGGDGDGDGVPGEWKPLTAKDFGGTELVEDNLPESLTAWYAATCQGIYDIHLEKHTPLNIRGRYRVAKCERGPTGSHGGCPGCGMCKVRWEPLSVPVHIPIAPPAPTPTPTGCLAVGDRVQPIAVLIGKVGFSKGTVVKGGCGDQTVDIRPDGWTTLMGISASSLIKVTTPTLSPTPNRSFMTAGDVRDADVNTREAVARAIQRVTIPEAVALSTPTAIQGVVIPKRETGLPQMPVVIPFLALQGVEIKLEGVNMIEFQEIIPGIKPPSIPSLIPGLEKLPMLPGWTIRDPGGNILNEGVRMPLVPPIGATGIAIPPELPIEGEIAPSLAGKSELHPDAVTLEKLLRDPNSIGRGNR
jgi:hypothetical protein